MPHRLFRDRRDAGQVLAGHLEQYRDRGDVIVVGLPCGGVPVAYEVATALGAPLDVFVVRKLGAWAASLLAFITLRSRPAGGIPSQSCQDRAIEMMDSRRVPDRSR